MGHEARSSALALAAAKAEQARSDLDERLVVAMERQANALALQAAAMERLAVNLGAATKRGGAFNRGRIG